MLTQLPLMAAAEEGPASWNDVQTALNNASNGAVIDLSEISAGPDSPVTFNVGSDKTLTLKGNGTQLQNLAFVFGGNNSITIDNLNIKSADNHTDYSPLHFTGVDNTLTLVGTNTVTSGQTSSNKNYGAAVGVPADAAAQTVAVLQLAVEW